MDSFEVTIILALNFHFVLLSACLELENPSLYFELCDAFFFSPFDDLCHIWDSNL